MNEYDSILITGKSIESELSFITLIYNNNPLLIFSYFEDYFCNRAVDFTGFDEDKFEKIADYIDNIVMRSGPNSSVLNSIICIALEAALEGGNWHHEMEDCMNVFCEGNIIHWSNALYKVISYNPYSVVSTLEPINRYFYDRLQSSRQFYRINRFTLNTFETETSKFLLSLKLSC